MLMLMQRKVWAVIMFMMHDHDGDENDDDDVALQHGKSCSILYLSSLAHSLARLLGCCVAWLPADCCWCRVVLASSKPTAAAAGRSRATQNGGKALDKGKANIYLPLCKQQGSEEKFSKARTIIVIVC